LQEIEATRCVLSYCGRKYRFQRGLVLAEYDMPSLAALRRLRGAALVRAGIEWKCATPAIRRHMLRGMTGVYAELAERQWKMEVGS
jgi:hypothetical protein